MNNYEDPFFPNEEKKNENNIEEHSFEAFQNNISERSENSFTENCGNDYPENEPFASYTTENQNASDCNQSEYPSLPVFHVDPTVKKVEKKKKQGSPLWAVILIMLPILVISNVLTSIFVFNKVWEDAQTVYDEKIEKVLQKASYSPEGGSYTALNVAKECIKGVLEINVSYQGGSAAGTGFIISENGYVITNAHVVTYEKPVRAWSQTIETLRVDTVTCKFHDSETEYELEIIDYDTDLDIAVLKFKNLPKNATVLQFADSGLISYGEPAVAIGNAQGYGLAVTEGVISAPMQYFNLGNSDMTAAIQHSAAINPGNSGGPLFNVYGNVVGINTFKLTNTNEEISIDGMGFAIPSVVVKDFVNGLNLPDLKIEFVSYNG